MSLYQDSQMLSVQAVRGEWVRVALSIECPLSACFMSVHSKKPFSEMYCTVELCVFASALSHAWLCSFVVNEKYQQSLMLTALNPTSHCRRYSEMIFYHCGYRSHSSLDLNLGASKSHPWCHSTTRVIICLDFKHLAKAVIQPDLLCLSSDSNHRNYF